MKSRWLWLVLLANPCLAQDDPAQVPEETRDDLKRELGRNVGERIARLLGSIQQLGSWDEHYGYMVDAVGKVYERNGWQSEEDQFSFEVFREVEKISPLSPRERFDTMIGLFSDRYLLTPEQEAKLRGEMLRMTSEVFSRHSARIAEYAVDAIQTRARGDAITAEQVARWAQLATPVFEDMRGRVNGTAQRFMQELDPEQRALLQRDLSAANRRFGQLDQMRKRWIGGQWRPEDWGIENDPIQVAGMARLAAEKPEAAGEQPADSAAAKAAGLAGSQPPDGHESGASAAEADHAGGAPGGAAKPPPVELKVAAPKPAAAGDRWAQYVQAFIDKFSLDETQQQRAWLIHGEVKQRVDVLTRRYAERRESANRTAAASAPADQAAREQQEQQRLFEQMKRRLERIPTRAQKAKAGAGEIPPPIPLAVQGGKP
jgi:hypothetical protein